VNIDHARALSLEYSNRWSGAGKRLFDQANFMKADYE
jgi:hypothetical protein